MFRGSGSVSIECNGFYGQINTDHQRKIVKHWRVQVLICWSLNAETTDGNSPFYLLVFCPKAIKSIQQPPFSSAVFILVDEGAREVSPDIIARIGGPHIGGKWCWERYQILKSTGCFYCTKGRLTITIHYTDDEIFSNHYFNCSNIIG